VSWICYMQFSLICQPQGDYSNRDRVIVVKFVLSILLSYA
jgi:hypothetical protein